VVDLEEFNLVLLLVEVLVEFFELSVAVAELRLTRVGLVNLSPAGLLDLEISKFDSATYSTDAAECSYTYFVECISDLFELALVERVLERAALTVLNLELLQLLFLILQLVQPVVDHLHQLINLFTLLICAKWR